MEVEEYRFGRFFRAGNAKPAAASRFGARNPEFNRAHPNCYGPAPTQPGRKTRLLESLALSAAQDDYRA
jgi:hypothetical protein